jgi:hypothetical protein
MTRPLIISAVNTVAFLRKFGVPTDTPVIKNDNPYVGKIPEGELADPAMYLSALGTPVVADIVFEGGTYTDDETGRQITFQSVTLATVLVSMSQPKRIIRTEIQGRDGSVKEYIGMDDYQVTIQGVITGANGVYPFQAVAELHKILKAPITIPVVSAYLQLFDIFSLVVVDFSFDQEPGGYSKQNFIINAISDKPVELLIQ